ncbi:MAG: tryptophan synthase subunit alpha [Ignavibacteria bacterium RBG_16_34_14]|nr:MAG: tryptophan synthase subunit alpha [Ignavibacteria bacterium RBG_16_34_14]
MSGDRIVSIVSNYIKKKNEAGEKVLSVFLTSGFPNKNNFVKLALNILDAGADILEIGFPFSDPLADGPIIQASSQEALKNGINLQITFKYVKEIRKNTNKPIILMGYANPVLSYGIDRFADDIKSSGANGVIIPDVPIDEFDNFFNSSFDGIDKILLITPTTNEERVKEIDGKSSGFVYCVSISGTTGLHNIDKNLELIQRNQKLVTKNKMLVGFGISNEDDIKKYIPYCDGVIVGSAVIKSLMNENKNYIQTLDLVKSLKTATNI